MSGSSDEEGKSMKNSDTEEQDKKTDTEEEVQEEGEIQQEEEDETDTEAAADTEVSDKLVVLSSGEENDDLPSKKQKYASLNQLSNVKSGPDPSQVPTPPPYSRKNQSRKMSESSDEEGKSMKNADKKEEEEYDAEEEYDDEAEKKADDVNPSSTKRKHVDLESCDQRSRNVIPKSKEIKSSTRVDNKEEEDFVFEVQLSLTDFQSQKLTIPWETVEKYFLDADTRTQLMIRVLLTDKYNDQKHVRCSFSPQLGGDFIITEWSWQFGPHKAMDLIRFYKPLPQPSHYQHYLVGYLKFVFEKTLTTTDVSQKLVIPIKTAENHFPCLITNKQSHAMLQISDAQNKKWEMKFHVALVPNQSAQRYGYKMDWTEFVTKHKLEAGNVIFFYKPVLPSEDNHYAIRFERPSKKDDSKKGGNKDIHPENLIHTDIKDNIESCSTGDMMI